MHTEEAKHLLCYFAGSVNFSITYKKGGFKLAAYSDASWSNIANNEISASSYIVMLANGLIRSKASLQNLSAQSTMEAGLVAAVSSSKMMVERGFEKGFSSVPLYLDNS